jgi:hypothetical protein
LSLAFGVIAQRTRFCTMGAVADGVNMGDWTRARMWALAIAVTLRRKEGRALEVWIGGVGIGTVVAADDRDRPAMRQAATFKA